MAHYFTKTKISARGFGTAPFGQTEIGFADNSGMPKSDIRQIFIKNLEQARKMRGLNKGELAQRAGMSGGHLSEVINGLSDITLGKLADLAAALNVMPMELLADSETARQVALARIAWGQGVSDKEVEQHLPPAPHEEEAHQPKKRRQRDDGRSSAAE